MDLQKPVLSPMMGSSTFFPQAQTHQYAIKFQNKVALGGLLLLGAFPSQLMIHMYKWSGSLVEF